MSERIDELREQLRTEKLTRLPKWYSASGQVCLLAAIGLAAALLSARNVEHPRWFDWLAVPWAFVTSNLFEWGVHKGWMHRARWPRALYRSHTLSHHKLYLADDMAMKDPREVAFVLLNIPTLILIITVSFGFAYLVRAIFGGNVAWLFFSTEMSYLVFAELMHVCYHLPKSHRMRQFFWIRWLAKPHVLHHDMRLMRRWNFNIGIPFWDLIFRTFTLKRYPEKTDAPPE